jgi:hypothetical protein
VLVERAGIPVEKARIPVERAGIPVERAPVPVETAGIPVGRAVLVMPSRSLASRVSGPMSCAVERLPSRT